MTSEIDSAPACPTCSTLVVRTGPVWRCLNCGWSGAEPVKVEVCGECGLTTGHRPPSGGCSQWADPALTAATERERVLREHYQKAVAGMRAATCAQDRERWAEYGMASPEDARSLWPVSGPGGLPMDIGDVDMMDDAPPA